MAMKIGVRIESFRQGFEGGVKAAAALGIEGIQANATYDELAPEKMTKGYSQIQRCMFFRSVRRPRQGIYQCRTQSSAC